MWDHFYKAICDKKADIMSHWKLIVGVMTCGTFSFIGYKTWIVVFGPHIGRRKALHKQIMKELPVPKMYPLYVEQEQFCRNIKAAIDREDGGIALVWGPPGNGKSTYIVDAIRSFRCHLVIHADQAHIKAFPDNDDDCGKWLNSILDTEELLEPDESFAALINKTFYHPDWWIRLFYRTLWNKLFPTSLNQNLENPVILYIDQFENCFSTKNAEYIKRCFKKLAEESVRYKRFIVILALKDPVVAREMYNINGGVKVFHITDDANNHKWSEKEVRQFFDGASKAYQLEALKYDNLTQTHVDIALQVGTPQQCKVICDAVKVGGNVDGTSARNRWGDWEVAKQLE